MTKTRFNGASTGSVFDINKLLFCVSPIPWSMHYLNYQKTASSHYTQKNCFMRRKSILNCSSCQMNVMSTCYRMQNKLV